MNFTPIRTSLRKKIFLRFTLLVGLAISATGILSILTIQSIIKQDVMDNLVSLAQQGTDGMEYVVSNNKSFVRMMVINKEINEYNQNNSKSLRAHFVSQMKVAPDIYSISLLSPRGKTLVTTNSKFEEEDFSFLEQAQHGMDGVYHGPIYLSDANRTYVISAPVRDDKGILKGVLMVEFLTEPIYKKLVNKRVIGNSGKFLIMENKNEKTCINPKYISLSKNGLLENELNKHKQKNVINNYADNQHEFPSICNKAINGYRGIISSTNKNGEKIIAVNYNAPTIGISLIVSVEEKEIWEPIRTLLAILIGTTFILLLLVTLIAFRLARDVVIPIKHIQKSLKGLNTGNWKHELSIVTGDELEVLDNEVSRLATRLEEAYSSLGKKVKERTKELASAHAKDEALIESIGEGFLAMDLNGKILTVNRATESILQWDRVNIIGSHFGSVLHLKTKKGFPIAQEDHIIEQALQEKAIIRTAPGETILCEKQDGSTFPIGIVATPFLLGMEIQGVVVTIRDMTEEKRLDNMKSEFISLASHQLRTPLTAIGWYIELLKSEAENLSPDQEEYADQILQSHKRMVELVNSLLNVSRIELGRVKIEPKKITIKELVQVPLQYVQPQIEQKNLLFHKRLPELTVSVDANLVRMVLENLLSNAVKYTPEHGSVELAVIADHDELQISVSDTGMGIPQTQQKRIFEKLFRADNVVKTDTKGTGIGLYIAKSTVEAWGGKLWFKSREKKGATFTFTLPRNMKASSRDGDVIANTTMDSS